MYSFRKILLNKSNDKLILLFRYGCVVAVAGPIDLGGYVILKSNFHVNYVLSATISFTVSLLVNYALSMAWVWKSREGTRKHIDAIIFIIIGIVGLLITDLVIFSLTHFGKINYLVSKLIAFMVVFFWSFGARHLLFKNNFDII